MKFVKLVTTVWPLIPSPELLPTCYRQSACFHSLHHPAPRRVVQGELGCARMHEAKEVEA